MPGVSRQRNQLTTARVFLMVEHPSGEAEVNHGSKQGDYLYE